MAEPTAMVRERRGTRARAKGKVSVFGFGVDVATSKPRYSEKLSAKHLEHATTTLDTA